MSGGSNMFHGALRVTRTLALIALFLLFAAVVWWLGPELRVGDSRPLDPPGWRIGVIALIPLLLLLPLLGGALTWSWRQMIPTRTPRTPDEAQLGCADMLHQMRTQRPARNRGEDGNWRQLAGWLADHGRRAAPWFAPDMLIVAEGETAAALQRHWPWDMEGACSHGSAGDAFWSAGLCWLIVAPAQLPGWARTLRWRPSPRAALWLVDEQVWSAGRHEPALDMMRDLLRGWRDVTGRRLPLWLCPWTWAGDPLQAAWSPATDELPRGFTLPSRDRLALRGKSRDWEVLAADYRAILESSLNEDALSPGAALARMRILQQCDIDIAATPEALRKIGAGPGIFATATARGLFWLWENGRACIGLPGLLHVMVADRPTPRYRFGLAVSRAVAWLMTAVGVITLAQMICIDMPMRHARALEDWHTRQSEVRRAAVRAMRGDPVSPLDPGLNLLSTIEDVQAQAQTATGEALPIAAQSTMTLLEARLWRQHMLPALLDWNRACLDAPPHMTAGLPIGSPLRAPSMAFHTPQPVDYYRALATALLLTSQHRLNEPLLRESFTRCGATPERADGIIHQLTRQLQRPDAAPVHPPQDDIAAWRSSLAGPARYTLDDRLWDGMRLEMRPASANDFDLAGGLGPGAFWFASDAVVPWLYTSDGLQTGFRESRHRFRDWIEEYRWVMAQSGRSTEAASTDRELAALDGVLRARYVRESVGAWEAMFDAMRLVPVRTIGDAVDRAQTFGSDASPFIQLLDTLEQTMPLPPRKTASLWSRVTTRVSNDWARLQYEMGWRNSPRSALQTSDPSYAIAQHFALLRSFFPDAKGKAPARDRMLQTIQPIARYLTRQQAAVEFGGRPPAPASMAMLRVQAGRLPGPLRQLVQDLANDSGRQLGREQLTNLTLGLEAVPSYLACQLDAPFPLSVRGTADLDWGTFVQDFAANGRIAQMISDHSDLIDATRTPWQLRLPPGATAQPGMARRIAWLQRATRVGQAWFPPGGSALQFTLRSLHLDNRVLQARLVIDGQSWTYAHGASRAVTMHWPGPDASETVDLELQRVDGEVIRRHYSGPWALLALVRDAQLSAMRSSTALQVLLGEDQATWSITITAGSAPNPLNLNLYRPLCAGRDRAMPWTDLFTPVAVAPSRRGSSAPPVEEDGYSPAG